MKVMTITNLSLTKPVIQTQLIFHCIGPPSENVTCLTLEYAHQ
jgi:hypothetical protein